MSKDVENKKPKQNIFKVFFRLFPIAFRTYPAWFLLTQTLSIFHGVSWGAITLFTQRFFDTASNVVTGQANISAAFISLVYMGLAHFLSQVLNGVGNFVPQIYADKAIGRLQILINKKMGRMRIFY